MATGDDVGGGGEGDQLDRLPAGLLSTIMSRLDAASICSFSTTCKAYRAFVSHIFTFIPNFRLYEVALPFDSLRPLLPPNPSLKSLKLDCRRLDDTATSFLVRPSLEELSMHNCFDFSGKLLIEIGERCPDLRYLYLGSVAGNVGRSIGMSDWEKLLTGCKQLKELILMFNVYMYFAHKFHQVWESATGKLESLEIGYIPSFMVTELFSPNAIPRPPNSVQPSSTLPNIRKLCLYVDCVTDTMVATISSGLVTLTHLDLRDAPFGEPTLTSDLTNSGLSLINQHGKLKHLSLIRSQEYFAAFFRRVTDPGLITIATKAVNMESLCLGGFCHVTYTGFNTVLLSCPRLHKLIVRHGTHLTEHVFRGISTKVPLLSDVSLRWCHRLSHQAISHLVSNQLEVLDLRECKKLNDDSLKAIGRLSKLRVLKLDGSDVTDSGLSFLRPRVMKSLTTLSLRGCRRLTDECISALFDDGGTNSSNPLLQELDLSCIYRFSDRGILSLIGASVPISKLRLRECPLVTEASVAALASMDGNCLRLLDLHDVLVCISQNVLRWFEKPYFPKLRSLGIGITGCGNQDAADALARTRPFLHVERYGSELVPERWDNVDGLNINRHEEFEALEMWLLGEREFDDVDMVDAENPAGMLLA